MLNLPSLSIHHLCSSGEPSTHGGSSKQPPPHQGEAKVLEELAGPSPWELPLDFTLHWSLWLWPCAGGLGPGMGLSEDSIQAQECKSAGRGSTTLQAGDHVAPSHIWLRGQAHLGVCILFPFPAAASGPSSPKSLHAGHPHKDPESQCQVSGWP
jgi:hypothetical protein